MIWNPFKRRESAEEDVGAAAAKYAAYQMGSARGDFSRSDTHVALMTIDKALCVRVREALESVLAKHNAGLTPRAPADKAVSSAVVLFDVNPKVDARLHSEYDRCLRLKKSMKKFGQDMLGNIGPRKQAKRYRRGTYGTLYHFCYDAENPEHTYPDIPQDGLPTVQGPTLFNLSELPRVVDRFLGSLAQE